MIHILDLKIEDEEHFLNGTQKFLLMNLYEEW